MRHFTISLVVIALIGLGCSSTPKPAVSDQPSASAATQSSTGETAPPEPVMSGPAAPATGSATDSGWKSVDVPPSSAVPNPDEPEGAAPPEGAPSPEIPREPPALGHFGQAPAFKVTGLDGKIISSKDLYGKGPVSLTFWATWCPPCNAEAPVINELYGKYHSKVHFLGISIDDPMNAKGVKAFVRDKGLKYPIAHDLDRSAGKAFDSSSIPLTVLINAQGEIIGRLVGFGGRDQEGHPIDGRQKVFDEFETAFGLGQHTVGQHKKDDVA